MVREHVCGESFEPCCAGCDEIASSQGRSTAVIASELTENDDLGFAELISVLIGAGWQFSVDQLIVDGYPRIVVRGTPVDQYGRARLDKREVTAIWERRPQGWVARQDMTGHQAIGGGLFQPAHPNALASLVADNPATWIRVPHKP